MKKYLPTIVTVAIFLALLGSVIYIYRVKPVEEKKPQVIFQINVSKISSMLLTSKGETMEFKKLNSQYLMYIPEEVPSTQKKVQELFNASAKINYQEIIAQKENNLAQFGFENPKAIVRINLADGLSRTFQIGIKAPSGDGSYLREVGQKTVYKISEDIASQFTQGINDIADKKMFSSFDKNRVDKVIVDFDNQTKILEKKNEVWMVDNVVMKQDKTNQLIDQFREVSVDGISPKDKYINTSIPPLLRIVVYDNGVENLNIVMIKRDDSTINVIKESIVGVQYYITTDNYEKTRDNLLRVFGYAVTP